MNTKTLLPVVLVPSCVVAIPALAMLIGAGGWAWDAADFAICWVVVAAAVVLYKFVASYGPNRIYRFGAGIAAVTGVILLWVNGAVGFIGSENNPANLMYLGVLALGLAGAAIARLRPTGMARALAVTAVAQFLVPVIALFVRPDDFSPGVAPVFGLNFFFVLLFVASALLFRRAGAESNLAQQRR